MNSPILLAPGVGSEQQWLKQIALFLGLILGTIVLAFCFFASSLCITIVLSAFLAIVVRMAQARAENRVRLRPYIVTRNYKLFGKEESKAKLRPR